LLFYDYTIVPLLNSKSKLNISGRSLSAPPQYSIILVFYIHHQSPPRRRGHKKYFIYKPYYKTLGDINTIIGRPGHMKTIILSTKTTTPKTLLFLERRHKWNASLKRTRLRLTPLKLHDKPFDRNNTKI